MNIPLKIAFYIFWVYICGIVSVNQSFAVEVNDTNAGIAVISGHGEVLPDEYAVGLYKWVDGYGETVATDTIVDGKFRLEVPVEEGFTIGSLFITSSKIVTMRHLLYLTPGAKVEIDAVDNYSFTWPVKSSVPEQAIYDKFINNSKELWIKYQKASLEYDKKKYSLNDDQRERYERWSDSIRLTIRQRDVELLKTLPVETVWMNKAVDLALMSRYNKTLSEEMRTLYAELDDSVKNSPKGRKIYDYLYPGSHIAVGDKFPDIELFDLDGKSHCLSEFKGKWCLVDFWKIGCAPCLRALPELRELKEMYGDKLAIVSLSLDSESRWQETSNKLPLISNNWNEGKEDYGLFTRLGLKAYPSYLVVAPDGTIKDLWLGYDTGELKQKMSQFLE